MVYHGTAVECRDDWMVEGVWDDDFSKGEFHRSESFFGSGIRIEDDCVYFVPSSALVDRLFCCFWKGELLVANSLSVLLGFTGAGLKKNHNYNAEIRSILKGIKEYDKRFTVEHPEIDQFYQVYHENIVVKDGQVSFGNRTSLWEVRSFQEYREVLMRTLEKIRRNYESTDRRIPITAFSTMASGYDSPAISCLVRDIGVRKAFTSRISNGFAPRWIDRNARFDDGDPVAAALGIQTLYLEDSLGTLSEDELYFYSASCAQPELALYPMASYIERNYAAAVVFTGYHGDGVWDANTKGRYVSDEIVRVGLSGLGLSEIRLKSGFINAAIPFVLVRSIASIVGISLSAEMDPWRLHNPYDRPIPRRMLEGAGVGRNLFGIRKKGIVRYRSYPVGKRLKEQYFSFLKKHYNIRPMCVYLHERCNLWLVRFVKGVANILNVFSPGGAWYEKVRNRLFRHSEREEQFCCKRIKFNELLFVWSNNVLSERVGKIVRDHVVLLHK